MILIGCTPNINYVSYTDTFKKWNFQKKINEVDSSASLVIYFNTYKGLFEGRESFLSFKDNDYHVEFKKNDSIYTENDIKSFFMYGYYMKDSSFIPNYCKVRVKHINSDRIVVEFEIRDTAIRDKLKGKFKLKLDNEYPNLYDIYKYYKN